MSALITNALPVWRWQSRQWQQWTNIGARRHAVADGAAGASSGELLVRSSTRPRRISYLKTAVDSRALGFVGRPHCVGSSTRPWNRIAPVASSRISEQERPIDAQRVQGTDDFRLNDHAGRARRHGPLLVDGDGRLMNHIGDVEIVRAVDRPRDRPAPASNACFMPSVSSVCDQVGLCDEFETGQDQRAQRRGALPVEDRAQRRRRSGSARRRRRCRRRERSRPSTWCCPRRESPRP